MGSQFIGEIVLRYRCNFHNPDYNREGYESFNRVSDIARRLLEESRNVPDGMVLAGLLDTANGARMSISFDVPEKVVRLHPANHPEVEMEDAPVGNYFDKFRQVEQYVAEHYGVSYVEDDESDMVEKILNGGAEKVCEYMEAEHMEFLRYCYRLARKRNRARDTLARVMVVRLARQMPGVSGSFYDMMDEIYGDPAVVLDDLMKAETPEQIAAGLAKAICNYEF